MADRTVIYEWPALEDMLISRVLPNAPRILAGIHDPVEQICSRIPHETGFFLFHISATFSAQFPACRPKLIEILRARGIEIINGEVTDISKRAIQQYCRALGLGCTAAAEEGDPDELLIVKTDMNFGAAMERKLPREQRKALSLSFSWRMRGPGSYKVLPRRSVKASWWRDHALVIDRYIQNRGHRILKLYIVLDRLVLSDAVERGHIKKMDRYISRANSFLTAGETGPAAVHICSDFPASAVRDGLTLASHMGLSFGTLDIVFDDGGNCYVVDVNSTPGLFQLPQPGLIEHLSQARLSSGCR